MPLRILIIGKGEIARFVLRHLESDPDIAVTGLLCRAEAVAETRAAFGDHLEVAAQLEDIRGAVDVAIDCSCHGGLAMHGPDILLSGIDLITICTGALADDALAGKLETCAQRGNSTLELAAGAVGGIDALAAARLDGLHEVSLVSRKPPAAWRGSPAETKFDLDDLKEPTIHFSGDARTAARRYDKNANVAAMVALAGLGLDDTKVTLIADPDLSANRHEITAKGQFGSLRFEIEAQPMRNNPKSAMLAAMSVVRAVRNRVRPLRI